MLGPVSDLVILVHVDLAAVGRTAPRLVVHSSLRVVGALRTGRLPRPGARRSHDKHFRSAWFVRRLTWSALHRGALSGANARLLCYPACRAEVDKVGTEFETRQRALLRVCDPTRW